MTSALVALFLALGCLVVIPTILQSRSFFDGWPHAGLTLWVSLSVVGWISAVVFFLEVAIDPSGAPLLGAVTTFVRHLTDGHPLRGLGMVEVVGLSLSIDTLVVFTGALIVVGWRTGRHRRNQRAILDLVAVARASSGVRVLEHIQPLAFYLPGDGGRVVLSSGAIALLSDDELDAVVLHERGHHHGHHGSFLVPLQTLSSFVRFLPLSRLAPVAIRGYLEMMADDFASTSSSRAAVRSALAKAAAFHRAPVGSFAVADQLVLRRLERLERCYAHARDVGAAATIAGVAGGLAIALVLLPW
jgi:Zn-dependent protease with chaperone function